MAAIFTPWNTPRRPYNSHKWIQGMDVVRDETLFTDHARFWGDRIAAVVADSREAAETAVRRIRIQYQ